MSAAGRLISLEGVEGSGKSTLRARLAEALERLGYSVLCTREPGGSPLGEAVRAVVLDPAHAPVEPWSELFLMLAARAQLVRQVIEPALAEGRIVLCDRYMDASVAYQGGARGLGMGTVQELNRLATGDRAPHLTLLLDLDPEHGHGRLGGRRDRMEREGLRFHRAVRESYRQLAAEDPARWAVLDASGSPEQVAAEAWVALGRVLEGLPEDPP